MVRIFLNITWYVFYTFFFRIYVNVKKRVAFVDCCTMDVNKGCGKGPLTLSV